MDSHTAPSTPSRTDRLTVPAFSPRPVLLSPRVVRSHAADLLSVKDVTLASGCELIVRGIGARDRTSSAVAVLTSAVKTIQSHNPDLANTPVEVKPYPSRGEWSTTCYVRLDSRIAAKSLTGMDAEPRCDLLLGWIDALTRFNSEWEVQWTPTVHGTDKRMWVRFPDLKEDSLKPGYQAESRDKLLAWAKSKSYPVCSSFVNKGGVVLSLASPNHVDEILAQEHITIKGFSEPLKVARGRQLEVLNAFEIAIMGVSDEYEGMDVLLETWLQNSFLVDDESTLAGTRSAFHEPDAFIFHMTTWQAASKVLSRESLALFDNEFSHYPSLVHPQPVYAINNNGVWKKSGNLRNDFAKGAESVNESMAFLHRRLDAIEKTSRQQHEATQLQLAKVTNSLDTMSNTVARLEDRVVNTQRAILAQSTQVGLAKNLSDVKTAKLTLRMQLVMAGTSEQRAQAQELIETVEREEAALEEKIAISSREFQTIVAGPVGQLLAAPTLTNNQPPMGPAPTTPVAPPGLLNPPSLQGRRGPMSQPKQVNEQRAPSNKRPRLDADDLEEGEVALFAMGNSTLVDQGIKPQHQEFATSQ